MSTISFKKMHGLGNDFVVLDARHRDFVVDSGAARALADRHIGIGCDQVIVLEPSDDADVFMRIFNPDGSEAGACGNATRCVASLIAEETGRHELVIRTIAGRLPSVMRDDGLVTVNMGRALLDWDQIPLAGPADTMRVFPASDLLGPATCTSMGNPHATFFVADADAIDLNRIGPELEHDPLFPERANIGVASLLAPGKLRLRVWERGAGITLACGSGACAAVVAAARRGITARHADIVMERGTLSIEWREDGHVLMTGPIALSFAGQLDLDALVARVV